MRTWTISDYDSLYSAYPPTEPTAPPKDECVRLGRELGKSPGAVLAQWNDARSAILGNKTAASRQLLEYLGVKNVR